MSKRRLTVHIDCESATFDILQALKFKNGHDYGELFILALTDYAKKCLQPDQLTDILSKHGKAK